MKSFGENGERVVGVRSHETSSMPNYSIVRSIYDMKKINAGGQNYSDLESVCCCIYLNSQGPIFQKQLESDG